MTKKKDLKERVRARQRKTGESYTTALAHVRRPHVAEAPSATAEARDAGLRCEAVVSERLRATGGLRPLFGRMREVLEALGSVACGPLLRGEPAAARMPQMRDVIEARRFVAAVRGGKRGLSSDGQMIAFAWSGHVVVAAIVLLKGRTPFLHVGLLDDVLEPWPPELALFGIGG